MSGIFKRNKKKHPTVLIKLISGKDFIAADKTGKSDPIVKIILLDVRLQKERELRSSIKKTMFRSNLE